MYRHLPAYAAYPQTGVRRAEIERKCIEEQKDLGSNEEEKEGKRLCQGNP